MDYIPLYITINSAIVFKNATYFTKMNLYVVASIGSLSKKTPIDKQGRSTPFWFSNLMFLIEEAKLMKEADDPSDTMVLFRVMCQRVLGFDEEIGRVRLRVKDLLKYYLCSNSSSEEGNGGCENAAFSICSPRSEKIRGILKLSYRFGSGDYRGIMNNKVSRVPSAPCSENLVVPSAPYYEDLDPCDSTYDSVQGHRGYKSAKPIPSAPYLPDEGLRAICTLSRSD